MRGMKIVKDSNVVFSRGSGDGPGSISSSLLEGVKARDSGAWQRLTAIYGPLVYSWTRQAGLSTQDAADVVQEVFLAMVTAIEGFHREQPGDSFRGWLWRVTRNKLRDQWRRGAIHPQGAGGSDALERFQQLAADEDASGSTPAVPGERAGLMRRALDQVRAEFEDRTWQAFWRVAVDGRRAADVAAELKISANAVYVARSRILRRLRDILGSDLVE
jgi:RNA polymerase sigma-70 factor, ECF subfamily